MTKTLSTKTGGTIRDMTSKVSIGDISGGGCILFHWNLPSCLVKYRFEISSNNYLSITYHILRGIGEGSRAQVHRADQRTPGGGYGGKQKQIWRKGTHKTIIKCIL